MWKQIIVGFSFANLCYLRVWSELLSYTPAQTYEMRLPPAPHDYYAAMLNVLMWGAVFGLAAVALARAELSLRRAGQWLGLLAMLVPLNALRTVLASRLPVGQQYLNGGLFAVLGPGGVAVLGMAAVAGGAFAVHRFRERIFGAATAALLIAAPFAPLTMAQAAWMANRYDPQGFADGPPAARREIRSDANRRIVWVIFDEWDQRLTFDDRPAGLKLPEIDRFRAESFAAANAYPPRDNTLESIPSLLAGRVVERAEPVGPAELRLHFRGAGGVVSWSDVPNVFDAARARGSGAALVGVYHPYCRVLVESLDSCWWQEMPRPINSNGSTLGAAIGGQTRSLFETWRLSLFGQSLSARRKAGEFPEAVERAKSVAADPSYGFVLIHLLTPHFPHAYDRASQTFTLGNRPVRGYYDSLALTERVWGELRRAIEAAGLWDRTAVLLTSDHAMKHSELLDGKADSRVPFLLKLPMPAASPAYEPEFNTVVTRELLLGILDGRIVTAAQLADWLAARSGSSGRASD